MISRTARLAAAALLLAGLIALPVAASAAAAPVNLGSTAGFAILGDTVRVNETSTVVGDAGYFYLQKSPGGLIVSGNTYGRSELTTALADLQKAYDDAAGRKPDSLVMGLLGAGDPGMTLLPGVYGDGHPAKSLDVTGTLYLDAQGNPDAVWIFQTNGHLDVNPGTQIVLKNGARFCRVFWIADTVDIRRGSKFVGHVIAAHDITAHLGSTVEGQLMTLGVESTVLLEGNVVTNAICTPWIRLPKTGYPPRETGVPWGYPVTAIVCASIAVSMLRRRARTSR